MLKATCHCGAVELALAMTEPLETARRCTCSFCKRRQAANVSVPVEALTVVKGEDALSRYSWGTHTAQHYFCKHCGIYTHHRRRADPREYGVNLYCIEDISPEDHEPLGWHDGVNHPSDA